MWIVLLAMPTALLVLMLSAPSLDLRIQAPTEHFYVVTVVAALATVLAVAIVLVSRVQPSARTFFLAMAFLSMAAIFLAHGLGTSPVFRNPQTDEEFLRMISRLRVVGYSAQLSLSVSAVFFWLSTIDFRDGVAAWIARRQTILAVAIGAGLAGHVYAALWYPALIEWAPIGDTAIAHALGLTATVMLAFAGWRFYQSYRFGMLPLQVAMAISMALLVQAQWSMMFGELWQLSWWMYHFVLLAGFSVGVVGLLNHARITKDLGAIVEGLFLRQQVKAVRSGDPRALVALGAAVAAKDSETADHIERVGDLSVAVGEKFWLPDDKLTVLRWAGRLHDVGKIGVPANILRKPGALTSAEFEIVKQHTTRGWEIALRSGVLAQAAPIIRAHHERLDGAGYPDNLTADQIPLGARIVAVADVWDALTCDRPYRAAMSQAEAAEILLEETGDHLDPDCVEALLTILGMHGYARQVNPRSEAA